MLLKITRPTVVGTQCGASVSGCPGMWGGSYQKWIGEWYSIRFTASAISSSAYEPMRGALSSAFSNPAGSLVRKWQPSTMSCDGSATGRPSDGFSTLFDEIISTRASSCASNESGTCTAIWSPSKSALNAAQTSG